MGYCICYSIYNLQIPAVHHEAALIAIHALFTPEQVAQRGTGRNYDPTTGAMVRSYRGVSLPAGGFTSLAEALQAWAFGSKLQPDGSLAILSYHADKVGDEAVLFDVLAPCLDASLEPRIDAYQENHAYWRHCFGGGIHRIVPGKVVYGDEHPELFSDEAWRAVQ